MALTPYLVRVESLTANPLYSYFISSVLYQFCDFRQKKTKNKQKFEFFSKIGVISVFSPAKRQ